MNEISQKIHISNLIVQYIRLYIIYYANNLINREL